MKRCFLIVLILALTVVTAFAQSQNQSTKGKMVPEVPRAPISWYSPSPHGLNSILSLKLFQDFESGTFPPTSWTLEYTGTLYWSQSTASGYLTGGGSAKFDFWSASTGTTQSLVTPVFTPTIAGDSLKFDYADAYYDASSVDSLILETSTDGGTTYSSLDRLYSSPTPYLSLSTVSTTSNFTPSLLTDWDTKHYALPVGTNKVRFKAISGYGNNLYIDNISIGVLPANDISAFGFITPASGGTVIPSTPFTPKGAFKNVGTATQTGISVKYQILNPSVVYTSTQTIASVAAGVVDTVTFDPVSAGLTTGSYTLKLIVATSDANSSNDTLNGTLSVLPAGTYLSEGFTSTAFPPSGWSATSTNTTVGWSRLAATQSDGSAGFAARENFYSQSTNTLDSLKTSTLNLSAFAPTVLAKGLSYDYAYAPYTSASDADSMRIFVSSDGGATWPTMIYSDGAPNMGTVPPQSASFTPSSGSQWRHMLIRIPDGLLTATTRVMFLAKSGFGNNLWLDNVTIANIPDTDYSMISVAQINGIPNPFTLVSTELSKDKVFQAMMPALHGKPATDINRSIMLEPDTRFIEHSSRTYLKGNVFSEAGSAYSINAIKQVTMNGIVTNYGLTSPPYVFNWTFDGVSQSPLSRGGIAFLASDTVALNIVPSRRGTMTAIGTATLAGDKFPANNSQTNYRVLSYPDTPVVRIRYDNGSSVPTTFIGFNGGAPSTAGVRFHTTANMRLANIDAAYRNEGVPDSIVVQVWSAGADTTAPGILLYTQSFAGVNYNATGGDYFTLPLGSNAPAFAAGSDYWVSIRFVQTILFPMGSQSTSITTGHSYISADSGRTWVPVIISGTEYAWLLRTVGVPASPSGPVASLIARSTRVPNAGDTVVVTATIVDSLGVTNASLLYKVNGVAWPSVPLVRVSGTPQNGSYRGVIPATADSNGKRVEYQIQAMSASGVTATTAIAAANSYFAGLTPMSPTGLRYEDSLYASPYKGYYARVSGTVNGPNWQAANLSTYIQDAFGGLNLYKSGALTAIRNLGDSVTVLGKLDQYRGVTEIVPDSLTDIVTVATGRTVTPITVTVTQYNTTPELYESRLIKFTSLNRKYTTPVWPPAATAATIIMQQTGPLDTVTMYINAGTNIPGSTEPTYPVNMVCIGTQFASTGAGTQGGYEVLPRYVTDFTAPAAGLSGTYTIGAAGNYTSLSAAVAALKANGVAGPVVFRFIDASYSDSGQVISAYPGQSTTNTVTFKPALGVTPRIFFTGGSTASNTFAVRMDSVVGVIWDGSPDTGSTRGLTIDCDTNTTTGRTAFFIREGSRNVTLKNMVVKSNRHSAGTISSVIVFDNTGFATSGGQHNMTVTNCQLMRGNNGIFVSAASGAVRDSNHTFTNNLIGGGSSTSVFDNLAAYGVTMTGNHNVLVDNNDVNGIQFAGTVGGIRVNGANTAVRVTRNKIHNVATLAGAAARPLCFLVGNVITTGPGVRTQAQIANNMIYDVHNYGTGASGRAVDGLIYNPTGLPNSANGVGSSVDWAYNSYNLNMGTGEGSGTTAFIFDANYAGSNTTAGQSDSIRFYNNIASVVRADSIAARMFLIFGEGSPGNLQFQSNNNVYNFITGPFAQIPSPWPGGTTSVFVNSVGEFRDSTRLDSMSLFGTPQFVSATDAHIRFGVPTPVESKGRIIAGINTDLDGNIRFGSPGYPGHGTAPDVGAHEGDFIPLGAIHDLGVASLGTVTAANAPAGGSSLLAAGPASVADYTRGEVFPDNREQSAVPTATMQTVTMSSGKSVNARTNVVSAAPARSTQEVASVGTNGTISLAPGSNMTFFSVQDTVKFRAVVRNYGAFPESTYQVRWTVDGTVQATLNNTRILAPAAQDTFSFRWNSTAAGAHVARAWTLLATDGNHANDTATANFTVTGGGPNQGDTLYTFIVPNQIILGVSKIPSNKLVFTSGGQSSTLTTDNKWVVTTMNGTILDTTHLQINNTSGQGFGFRDLAWDGRWLLTSDNVALRRIDTATYTEVRPQITGPGTLQRGLATESANRIWKSNFTSDPVVLFDTTGTVIKTLGVPSVAPYGIAFDKWTSPNKGYLWYSQPSVAGTIKLSKVDTATGAILATYDYSVIGGAAGSSGGLDIVNNHPSYPGRVVAFMVIQNFPASQVLVINLGPDSSVAQPTPGWTAQTSGITTQFYSVKAVNQTTAWAAAVGGAVVRTVNGGNTWTSVGGGHIGANDIYAIEAVSASTAFVTTSPSATYIFRTTNGGTSWDTVFTQAGGFIDAIKMFDANNGFALGDPVGGKWTLLHTSNGGATWIRDTANALPQVNSETSNQNDLSVVGSQNLWYGSTANGRIYRSTNGGTTWLTSTVPGATTATNAIAVWFNNTSFGIAAHYTTSGTYNAARSTDGGATWSAITVSSATTYNIAVAGTGNDFWMARATDVYHSTDRGATWASSYTGTGTFYDLDFYTSGNSTYGWGVKDNGNIVMYYGSVTDVQGQPTKEIPTTFALQQNYPNPFNPSTTIRYGLPEAARVSLNIYNVLGQRVATLTNDVQGAGFYNVVWNGRNDAGSQVASGIYFVRIEATPVSGGASPFTSLKKMVMLK